jgi:glutathione peroxidase-family protein
MAAETNSIIENAARITKYCTTDLKSEFQFMMQTAVINVGTHPLDIGKKASKFKSFEEETKANIKKATVGYRTQMVTSLV